MAQRIANRSSGNLGTQDAPVLWCDIIGHLPDSAFFKGMRILNLCAGTGTEALELVRRLRSLGWTQQEIRDTIVLIDISLLFTQELRRKGFTQVITADALTWDYKNMKFDIVLGNPPYQDPSQPAGKFWARFIDVLLPLINGGGRLVFVTPVMWLTTQIPSAEKIRKSIKLSGFNVEIADLDVDKYFPHVGEKICWFSLINAPVKTTTFLNSHTKKAVYDWSTVLRLSDNPVGESVRRKVAAVFPKIKAVQWTGKSKKTLPPFREEPDEVFRNPVMHTASQWVYVEADTSSHQGPKVLMNGSGHFKKDPKYTMVENHAVAGQGALHVLFNTMKEAENAYTYLTSKLYIFFVYQTKSGGFNHGSIIQLPELSCKRTWTDAELYEHFGLSAEEIALVEASVK